MLTKLSIQGFKSIYHIQDLELGQVNVFVGANGSGKSNLLEAVGLLSAATLPYSISSSLSLRGVRSTVSDLFVTSLKNHKSPSKIAFELHGEWNNSTVAYTFSIKPPSSDSQSWTYQNETFLWDERIIVEREDSGQSRINWPESVGGSATSISRSNEGLVANVLDHETFWGAPRELREFLKEFVIYSPTTPVLRGVQPDIFQHYPVGLLGGRLAEAVEEILDLQQEKLGSLDLHEIFELLEWVEDFDVTSPSRELLSSDVPSLRSLVRFTDYWMNKGRNQLSGYDASEGSLYVLFMLVLALHFKTPSFFAVENFDQMLHPRLARALTRLFCRLVLETEPKRQVLLTTHNPLVLDGLDLRDERIRLFAVERSQSSKGATKVHRVELSESVLTSAQNGMPLSMMWVSGLLGGVPDIF